MHTLDHKLMCSEILPQVAATYALHQACREGPPIWGENDDQTVLVHGLQDAKFSLHAILLPAECLPCVAANSKQCQSLPVN